MSDSPQKAYRRHKTRWIRISITVTLGAGALALLKDAELVPPTVYSLSLAAMIICWAVSALVWCTHCLMEECRRRERSTVNQVGELLAKHNVAGWAAYAEQAENVYPINRRR